MGWDYGPDPEIYRYHSRGPWPPARKWSDMGFGDKAFFVTLLLVLITLPIAASLLWS